MILKIEQKESNMTSFELFKKQKKQLELVTWTTEQLGILAIALGEPLTPARLRIYAEDLAADLSREQIAVAVQRARRELKFFPKLSELRVFAGVDPAALLSVEAEAAWDSVWVYLRKWGVEPLPIWSGGKEFRAPRLNPRIDYALRRVHGLRALNQLKNDSLPFAKRDFIEGYKQASLAFSTSPQLQEKFVGRYLLKGEETA